MQAMSVWMPTLIAIVPVVLPRVVAPNELHGPWPPELAPLTANVTVAAPGVIAPFESVPLTSCQLPVMARAPEPPEPPKPPALPPDPPGPPASPPDPPAPAHPESVIASSAETSAETMATASVAGRAPRAGAPTTALVPFALRITAPP
jgi:hypothetical protein